MYVVCDFHKKLNVGFLTNCKHVIDTSNIKNGLFVTLLKKNAFPFPHIYICVAFTKFESISSFFCLNILFVAKTKIVILNKIVILQNSIHHF